MRKNGRPRVDRKEPVPQLRRRRPERAPRGQARGVHEAVDAAERLARGRDGCLGCGRPGEIDRHRFRRTGKAKLHRIAVDEHERLRPGLRGLPRDRRTDAARGAGHEDHHPVERHALTSRPSFSPCPGLNPDRPSWSKRAASAFSVLSVA
jgi:hypothetical protein